MILINSANIYSFNTQSRKVFESVGFRRIAEEWYRYDIDQNQNKEKYSYRNEIRKLRVITMREIVSDAFYEFTKQYDMDREHL